MNSRAIEEQARTGQQRLTVKRLREWESLRYGMFIHFGMSTFDRDELSEGNQPSTCYCPDQLDVEQWVSVARDAGMKYAVLTAKHVSGHCLWPSEYTDYHVGTSGNPVDVVDAFVTACEKRGLMAGLYYCSWDNHHPFGSLTPSMTDWDLAYTTAAYQQFQSRQIEELLTRYGPVGEVWIDIPKVLPRGYRHDLYDEIAALNPDAVVMMNCGLGDAFDYPVATAWPSDLVAMERSLPDSTRGHVRWRTIEGNDYYLPGEVSDTIGKCWFYRDSDRLRSDAELLGMYLTTASRHASLLLDVPPDCHGRLPSATVGSLMRLRRNVEGCGCL